MAQISVTEDCDNAPKKKFILDFLSGSAEGDVAAVIEMVSEDIHLQLIGRKNILGKTAFKEMFEEDAGRSKVSELVVENILSHGNRCAANGTMVFEDGGKVAFSNVYVFDGFGKSAKLALIQVYSITF